MNLKIFSASLCLHVKSWLHLFMLEIRIKRCPKLNKNHVLNTVCLWEAAKQEWYRDRLPLCSSRGTEKDRMSGRVPVVVPELSRSIRQAEHQNLVWVYSFQIQSSSAEWTSVSPAEADVGLDLLQPDDITWQNIDKLWSAAMFRPEGRISGCE